MSYSIKHSMPAELDLDRIVHYIAIVLNNPKAAIDLRSELERKKANLRTNPRIYPISRIDKLAGMGYRSFTFGNYIAFFRIDDDTKTVSIIRFFYQKQDYASYL